MSNRGDVLRTSDRSELRQLGVERVIFGPPNALGIQEIIAERRGQRFSAYVFDRMRAPSCEYDALCTLADVIRKALEFGKRRRQFRTSLRNIRARKV